MTSESPKSNVKKALPAVVLVASYYFFSYLFALGIILGYLGSRIFYKKLVESGKIDCIYIDCGKWKIHFHHWIMGVIFLGAVWIIDKLYLPTFFAGAVVGIIAHDIYDFNDWYKVILKKDEAV